MAFDTLYIVDTMYLLFKSFFALENSKLHNRAGFPTGALYGLASALTNMRKNLPMQYCICAFESEEPTFRKELSPVYKANRPEIDPSLKLQIPKAIEMCERLGYVTVNKPGYEADDVIASIARRAVSGDRWRVRVISKDKDLAQLTALEGDIAIIVPDIHAKKMEHYVDKESCEKRYGVPPGLVGDWLALQGDSCDNIIGIKGVGPKTAAKILKAAGSLERLLANPRLAGERFANVIADSKAQLELNKRLVTLADDLDLPVSYEPQALAIEKLGAEGKAFFEELDMQWQRFV